MQPNRRQFLKHLGWLSAAGTGIASAARSAIAKSADTESQPPEHSPVPEDPMGVLVDLSVCVGCRLCEHACKKANGIDPGPLESYDDQSVFQIKRRPEPQALTVVNAWPIEHAGTGTSAGTQPSNTTQPAQPAWLYAKLNCVHCNYASCVSACIVGALRKQENGAVTYDAWKCIGCRYCMVACPFQLPAYSYEDALTPQVRKCQFCNHRTTQGQLPACVEACPRQALVYGKRRELIQAAHEKIRANPGKYVDHVYGEHEVGGTSWLYISSVPFQQAGFLSLGDAPPPALTEKIQHGVFKHWIAPIGWYSFLALSYWFTGRRVRGNQASARETAGHNPQRHEGTEARRHEGPEDTAAMQWLSLGTPIPCAALRGSVAAASPGRDLDQTWREGRAGGMTAAPARVRQPDHHQHDPDQSHAAPVARSLNTPGVWTLLCLVLIGLGFGLYRFIMGLGATTNLDQQHPWGLWIAMDVGSGIALAGGGFVTAALVHVFHREHYHAIARSALLTALLGYTFYVPGLLADIGRWYNIWHPTLPSMWQGNSVLFEVGICVMLYLNVQYAELAPIICQRLIGEERIKRRPWLHKLIALAHHWLEKIMPVFLVLGVTLSTFHQSSLGNLMVIAPYKLHPLWWTPISPILFLWSAMMVGFPMVIFTILFASWALDRKPEMHVLSPLALYVPVFLAVYLGLKIGDMIVRHTYLSLLELSPQALSWIAEMSIGVVLPLVMLLMPKVRRSPKLLAAGTLAVILGVVLNRLNCFVIGYHPPYATRTYFPSITEFAVSLGLVAALMLTYRLAVTFLPILEPSHEKREVPA